MSAKHTSGPWKRQSRKGTTRFRIVDAKGRQVADANHYNERAEENADLLAAAPELLEALREVLRASEAEAQAIASEKVARENFTVDGPEIKALERAMVAASEAEKRARAAIAKATGAQP